MLNQSGNSVSVFLGDGHGAFTKSGTFATGTNPRSIAVGDFNGDGRPDLAVANYSDGTVSVLLANGVGKFAPRVNYVTGTSPHGLATGDLNGDGKVDLVVANAGSNTVSVLLGNGDGTLRPKVDYATGAHAEKAVIADYNGDGRPDLAVINNVGNSVTMFLGNGDGTFTAGKTYATGKTPYWLAAGDLGNGKLDLVVANYAAATVSVLRGNGNGTFAAKVDYPAGTNPIALSITDINGDGLPDLVVTDHTGSLAVLLGKGDATFTAARFITTGSTPRFLTAGDFNGDGSPDLAVPFDTSNKVGILRNTTNSASPTVTETGTADGVWYFHVAAVDVNGNPGPTTTRQVIIDTTPPVTTDNAPSGLQNSGVTVTLTATDSGSGMVGGQAGTWYSLDGGAYTPGTSIQIGSGSHTLTYYSKDAAGNAEQPHGVTVGSDITPPVTTSDAPSGWVNQAVTVTLTATDTGSGMVGGQAGTWYSLDGGANTPGTSVLVSGEGTHTLTYYSEDAVGNVEQAHTATFGIDTTPPVTTDDAPSGWLTGPVTLTPTDSGSGMAGGQAGTWYSIDGGPYTAGSSVLFTDGTHTLTYYSRDAAGNVEQPHSTTVGVDTTPPVTTDDAPSGWQNGPVTVTLTPTDSGSGTSGGQAGTWYSIDGGPYTPGTSVQVTADGAHTLTYYSKDAAGNAETPHSVTVMTTLPTVAFTSPLGGESWPAGTSQTVSWTLSGALSVGQFRISFIDAANVQTTLTTFSATVGQTSYSQHVTLPAAPAAGSTCRIDVYWRSDLTVDTWQLTAQSNAFTVSYAYSGISEVGHATATGSGTAVSITPAVSTQAGDVVLAVIHANASGNTITDNNGTNAFTSDIQENTADSSHYAIVHRVATASEPTTYRWTLSSSQSWSVQVRVFRVWPQVSGTWRPLLRPGPAAPPAPRSPRRP